MSAAVTVAAVARAAEPPPAAAPDEPGARAAAAPAAQPASAAVAPRHLEARRLHDEAKQLYVAGRYEEALRKLDQALELDPQGKNLHFNKAFVAEKLGRLDQALEHYRICAELEHNPHERRRLESAIERVRGAKYRIERERLSAAAEQGGSPVRDRGRQAGTDFGSWPYIACGVGGGALLLGTVLAVHASVVAPDDGPQSAAGVSDGGSDAARGSAIGANVAFVTAAAAGTVALVLLIVERVDRAAQAEPLARSGELSVDARRGLVLHF